MDACVKKVTTRSVGVLFAVIGFLLSVLATLFSALLGALNVPGPPLPFPVEKPRLQRKGSDGLHEHHMHRLRRNQVPRSNSSTSSSSSDTIITPVSTSPPDLIIVVSPSHLSPDDSRREPLAHHFEDDSAPKHNSSVVFPPSSSSDSVTRHPHPPEPHLAEGRHLSSTQHSHGTFHLPTLRRPGSEKKIKTLRSVSSPTPKSPPPKSPPSSPPPPLPPVAAASKPVCLGKKAKALRKAPSAPGGEFPILKPAFHIDKKRSQPLRTQPYEAPYFFPPPGSAAALDYVPNRKHPIRSKTLPPPQRSSSRSPSPSRKVTAKLAANTDNGLLAPPIKS